MLPTFLSGLALAGLTIAQSTTVSLFIPGADTQPLVGSIIGSDSTATTYAVQCAPGTDSNDCGFPGVFTLTEGPSTAKYAISGSIEGDDSSVTSTVVAFTGVLDCSVDGKASSAICAESFGGEGANFPGTSTETITGTDFFYMPVVITAGLSNTGSAASPSSTSAAPTGSSTSAKGSKTSSGSGAAETGSSSAASSSTSTGGIPMITGNAGWVVGGVALAAVLL